MDSDRLNRWLTLGANLGVLVGIIFLAVEIRQTQAWLGSNFQMSGSPLGNKVNWSCSETRLQRFGRSQY